jgi:hypothetical protein
VGVHRSERSGLFTSKYRAQARSHPGNLLASMDRSPQRYVDFFALDVA